MDKIDWFNLFVWTLGIAFCILFWLFLWNLATYSVLGDI